MAKTAQAAELQAPPDRDQHRKMAHASGSSRRYIVVPAVAGGTRLRFLTISVYEDFQSLGLDSTEDRRCRVRRLKWQALRVGP